MIVVDVAVVGCDPGRRIHPRADARLDAERHFADDGDCLHVHYTTLQEACRAIAPLWLGSDPAVGIRLTFRRRNGRPVGSLTLSGSNSEIERRLNALMSPTHGETHTD